MAATVRAKGCDRTNTGQGCPTFTKQDFQLNLQPGCFMSVHNFEFIRSQYPALAQLLFDAERFLSDDSCCFLLKVRLALELWCHDFADLHGIALPLETKLAEKLELLSSQKVFPQDLLEQLMQLRQHANQAVHIQQDMRGRHITMQPLERAQQIAILKCLFELVCYTKRYQQPEFELPLWQVYPKQNLRLLLETAMGDAETQGEACVAACVQVSRALLQGFATSKAAKAPVGQLALLTADIQYWLQRGLRLGLQHASLEALHLLTELAFAKTHADIDLNLLADWLKQYQRAQPAAALDYLAGQLLERQNQLEKALHSYDKAAKAGHCGAIKRLLEYWGSRCQQRLQEYLQLGLQYNEPNALLLSMAMLLVDASKADVALPSAALKTLKGQLVKARGMSIAGVGYIEGMCHHLGILGYDHNDELAGKLLLENFQKVPAYCKSALNTFYVLFGAEQFHSALKVAPKALAQLDETAHRAALAELEFDIALSLLRLHEQKTPAEFFRTPRELLQSAAKRGYAKAHLYISSNAQQLYRNSQRPGRSARPRRSQSIGMPAWATTLAKRTERVSTVRA